MATHQWPHGTSARDSRGTEPVQTTTNCYEMRIGVVGSQRAEDPGYAVLGPEPQPRDPTRVVPSCTIHRRVFTTVKGIKTPVYQPGH